LFARGVIGFDGFFPQWRLGIEFSLSEGCRERLSKTVATASRKLLAWSPDILVTYFLEEQSFFGRAVDFIGAELNA